jgi:hypothetical protein
VVVGHLSPTKPRGPWLKADEHSHFSLASDHALSFLSSARCGHLIYATLSRLRINNLAKNRSFSAGAYLQIFRMEDFESSLTSTRNHRYSLSYLDNLGEARETLLWSRKKYIKVFGYHN